MKDFRRNNTIPNESKKEKLTELNYVDKADKVMQNMTRTYYTKNGKERRKIDLSTSKIRKLLAMISELYNDVSREGINKKEKLSDEMLSRIQYIKMYFAYEAGRENQVGYFVKEADIFEIIDDIGSDRKKLINFCHYMEALVAYRKYYAPDKE